MHTSITLTAKDERRFRAKVGLPNAQGCREWTGSRHYKGYGNFGLHGKVVKAHRVAWVIANRQDVPVDMDVLHRCDNPPCCEETHLFIGTDTDNQRDSVQKGRARQTNGLVKGHKRSAGEKNVNAKLTKMKAGQIRRLYAMKKYTQAALAEKYGVTEGAIRSIINGRTWS